MSIKDSKLNIKLKVCIFLLTHVQFCFLLLHVVTVIVNDMNRRMFIHSLVI